MVFKKLKIYITIELLFFSTDIGNYSYSQVTMPQHRSATLGYSKLYSALISGHDRHDPIMKVPKLHSCLYNIWCLMFIICTCDNIMSGI